MVYDELEKVKTPRIAAKEYLQVLNLAAKEQESLVDEVIRGLQQAGTRLIDSQAVKHAYEELKQAKLLHKPETKVSPVNLREYHQLFTNQEASWISIN